MSNWMMIAHGGARRWNPEEHAVCRAGMEAAVAVGVRVLANGGTALDAVESVVCDLENDPTFNAGCGAARNEIGGIQLDASIMDGRTLDIGAVIGLKEAANPVSVARALLRKKEILLAGEGAEAFARAAGSIRASRGAAPVHGAVCDTVGCVARDRNGDFAVATSTGGLDGAKPGRAGDVSLPGCGFYADNQRGAVALSGEGEKIARVLMAGEFLHLLNHFSPEEATRAVLRRLNAIGGEAGLIAITPDGRLYWDHNSPDFAVAWANAGEPAVKVQLRRGEAA